MNNHIDQIDAYLDGTMSAEESASFEAKMSSDASLQEQVNTQRNLRAGIERLGMKAATAQTFKKITLKNKLYKWGVATVAVAAIATAAYLATTSSSTTDGPEITYELPATNEEGGTNWADADRNLPTQLFTINPNKDTVVETMGGLVFAIPAGAFLDAKDPFTLEIREALTPMDIMKGGLSTTSNGELLETGGMFYLNARNGETSLQINPDKPVYANVPTNEIRPGMQLFEGERTADGGINWVNPKPMEKQLIPVDIFTLNFYPDGFLEKCAELGFDANDRKVTDSIYYSYAGRHEGIVLPIGYGEENYDFNKQFDTVAVIVNSMDDYPEGRHILNSHPLEIDPARIQAMVDDKFQNTIIATREFEERLQVIFQKGAFKALELYVNNLDKKLYQIDSMVVASIWNYDGGLNEFKEFYNRHDGGVAISQPHLKELQEYYQKKQEAVRIASEKTYNARTAEQRKQDSLYYANQTDREFTKIDQYGDNLRREYEINLKEAYSQLGISPKAKVEYVGGSSETYGFQVQTTGWKNVDALVWESTVMRTTLDYTDPITGKKAVIKYEPLQIIIPDAASYSQLMVYLVTDSLPCFMRVLETNGVYSEKLNELLDYSLVVMAEKDGTWYSATTPTVTPGSVNVKLIATDESTLRSSLNSEFGGKVGADFWSEINYMKDTHQFNVRKEKEREQLAIDEQIMRVIFPFFTTVAVQPATSLAPMAK